jgi:acyl dehydratase
LIFLAPVFAGDTVHLKSRLAEKHVRSRGRRAELVWHRQMINQEEKIVQEGFFHTLVEGKALHQRVVATDNDTGGEG